MNLVESSVDSVPIAFAQSGSGSPAIVFVHGLVGDHHDFDAQTAHFRKSHRVVAIDLPGAGQSGGDRTSWTMESLGVDVATVVDHLDLEDLLLVGHSLGGNVVVEAARRLEGRIKGVVCVSSFRSLESSMTEADMDSWFAPFATDFPAAVDDLNRRNFGPDADPELVETVTTAARRADQKRAIALLRSKFEHASYLVTAIREVDAPIIAINSDFKTNDAASFARHGVDLRIVPGAGHFVMREDPEAFNAELDTILRDLG